MNTNKNEIKTELLGVKLRRVSKAAFCQRAKKIGRTPSKLLADLVYLSILSSETELQDLINFRIEGEIE